MPWCYQGRRTFDMTAQQVIKALEKQDGAEINYGFAFPYVQVNVKHSVFAGQDDDSREAMAAQWLNTTIADLRSTANAALITFHWLAPNESSPIANRGDHWIFGRLRKPTPIKENRGPAVLHFFGYKGGQARSTVLAVLARSLAESGVKVLMIDADLEAPSLPDIWGKRPQRAASTLLGLYLDRGTAPLPLPCVATNGHKGSADLIAARLPEDDHDWEYDAFTIKALLDPSISQKLGERLNKFALENNYEVILVDQRTGASPATLNWFDALPGGYCIFARLDHQWRGGMRFYRTLADASSTTAGAIVSYKPDEENPETFRNRNAQQIEELNRILEEAAVGKFTTYGLESESEDWVADVDRWVMWPYDQSFRITRLPAGNDLGHATKEAIGRLRDLLELPSPTVAATPSPVRANLTGAASAEDLIQTSALRDLRTPNNPYSYIFGRKGTGKSTLFKALADERLGLPLVADDDFGGDKGLHSSDLRDFVNEQQQHNPENMWWRLLLAVSGHGNNERKSLRESLRTTSVSSAKEQLRGILATKFARSTLLIDGLETAFPSSHIHSYVAGLFDVMRALQGDSDFREKIEVKLFLRADLENVGVQNLELQTNGRLLRLTWDLQGILNFMLSRVASPQLGFFANNFQTVIGKIKALSANIREGVVASDEAFDLLLQIFPDKVSRVNAKMRTFLKLHFADSVSGEERYYPRFVQHFLDAINSAGKSNVSDNPFRLEKLEKGRLTTAVVQYAHDEASKQFLEQVRQELKYLLTLLPDQIQKLLGEFSGKQTPFAVSEMIQVLTQRLNIPEEQVRTAMENMKNLGIFEQRPGYEDAEWRAGRLFKAALKMKLRR